MPSFHEPLRLKPKFSYHFLAVLMTLYMSSGLILFSVSFPLPTWSAALLKLSLLFIIIVTAFHTMRYHLLLINHPLDNCVVTHQARVTLTTTQKGQLDKSCFSHPLLIILRVRVENNKIYTLILFADALESDIFRILSTHLHHAECDTD